MSVCVVFVSNSVREKGEIDSVFVSRAGREKAGRRRKPKGKEAIDDDDCGDDNDDSSVAYPH